MASQARKPKGSPNGTGGQFDHTTHPAGSALPSLTGTNSLPVGNEFMDTADSIARNLYDHQQDWDDLPIGGCYRIDDGGNYVTEQDWDTVWDGHESEKQAWMLSDNGQYTREQVTAMTPAEIKAAYESEDFYPEAAYYTEKDEDDYDLDAPIGATMAADIQQAGEQLSGQSRESMDFEPGEKVYATPTGFVSDAEWEQAWAAKPAYARAAYELAHRHPGLNMANLSPKQIITMNNSEESYEQYVWGTGRSNETDTDLDDVTRLNMDLYRQNERNAKYAGRDLNNVICMREAEYEGNDGTLTANVQDAKTRILDSHNPTADMDSMSTLALGLNHDPENTVRMLAGQMSTRGDTGGLKQSLQTSLASVNDDYDRDNAEKLSTILTCIENNADDTHGAAWLAAAMDAFASYRQGEQETARRQANQVRAAGIGGLGRPADTAITVADAILSRFNRP